MSRRDLSVIRAEIESEREWREKEILLLKNYIRSLEDQEHEKVLCKTLILLLYSHYEGLCKFIFSTYIRFINDESLLISQTNSALGASSLWELFYALNNTEKKHEYFKKPFPNDFGLHRFAREQNFLESIHQIQQRSVLIPDEKIANTESNLWPDVLKKILFRLGLDIKCVDPWEGKLKRLVFTRNDISHGKQKEGLELSTYEDLETQVKEVFDELVRMISSAIYNREFLISA